MPLERLQKVLAHAGVASRRAAEALIEAGRVTVNGKAVTELGTRVDAGRDAIKVDGRRIGGAEPPVYLAMHKPRGYVTTLSDPEGRPTVRDLLAGVTGVRVFPVGRLDFHSEGLLLLTNDGALARDLMHPSHGVPKVYRAKVQGTPDPAALARLRRGLVLDGRPTSPARAHVVRPGPNAWVEIEVIEGRKHQVRRMLEAVGHPVLRLRRIAYGGVGLGDLPPGGVRPLAPAEVRRLARAAGREERGARSR